ncbi:MAG: UvrD-helicase domain-containing protein, partial [Burkholderiales bacterium]|nr:UvrD-helicase domain-containing protein [Burkholderiales bacterium]
MTIKTLDGLNDEQLKAVTHNKGSMLVLAGAGSGKTKVLTTRMTWIIETFNILPHEILAVTFTNKAAKEMIYRVRNQSGIATSQMWVGTFHSIALKILYKYHKEAGLNSYFRILDAQEQLNVIKRVIHGANLNEERYPAKELQKYINNNKEQSLRANDLVANNFREQHWIGLYKAYEELCHTESLVDFTELLLRSFELLSNNSAILECYHHQFKHILVDEFQDTNSLQYNWIKLFKSNSAKIFAVGDDDQSIYSFRGAKVTNMQLFLKDFAIATPIRLQQNYRSTTNILQAANAVINNNQSRIGKNLWTQNTDGAKVRLYEGYTEEDEAFFVMEEIRHLINGKTLASDIAILYRSNAQSRILEQALYRNNIPYRVYGGLRFFDRQEIKIVLSYLRIALNHNDNEAFLKVFNFPPRGIGAKTIELLQQISEQNNVSLFDGCNFLKGKQKVLLANFTNIVISIKNKSTDNHLPEIIEFIIKETLLTKHYNDDKKNGKERVENLQELVNAVTNYKSDAENTITDFLTHTILESTDGQSSQLENAVQLMTVHAAKGLEFKVVFIVGLEEGLFPYGNSLDSEQGTEEERRLMYVAITRAKEQLYLLRA